ncbi:hypothetical protein WAE58_21660 [Pedobacter panaciterrae]|uniref:Immunity protein 26 of polymorphic toxin system n=1 Tax=Pedobacter panaciterrae TaxID=363849 RepID=A0ABU8NS40_9SPHI
MKVNELRKGNIVYPKDEMYNGVLSPCEVLGIQPDKKICYIGNSKFKAGHLDMFVVDIVDVQPILITPDWLVTKFGFKDNGGGYYQHPEYNFFLFYHEEEEYFECYKQVPANDDSGDFKTLQHVHRLQNLFYELFDEELTIK